MQETEIREARRPDPRTLRALARLDAVSQRYAAVVDRLDAELTKNNRGNGGSDHDVGSQSA